VSPVVISYSSRILDYSILMPCQIIYYKERYGFNRVNKAFRVEERRSLLKKNTAARHSRPYCATFANHLKDHIHDARREDLINSVKYLRNIFGSVFRIIDTHSRAVSGGQFCEGKKTKR